MTDYRATDYRAVYEHDADGWGAYVPDLPGCVATGATRAECESALAGAVSLHVEGLRDERHAAPRLRDSK